MTATTKLLTVAQVREITGISAYTLYQMAREGRIPAVKVGRSTRFLATEVDRWLAKLPKANA